MAINTGETKNAVKLFKRRKLLFNIMWFGACILAAIGILSIRNPGVSYIGLPEAIERWVLFGAAIPLFVGAILVYRCPVCGKYFWVNTNLVNCSKCKTVFLERNRKGIFS
jgi:predicted nucleic acid-binding Zn ribbon protein